MEVQTGGHKVGGAEGEDVAEAGLLEIAVFPLRCNEGLPYMIDMVKVVGDNSSPLEGDGRTTTTGATASAFHCSCYV